MIYPKLAFGYEDSRRVCESKSVHMVVYLRSRREASNYYLPRYRRKQADRLKQISRKMHLKIWPE